MKVIDNSTSVSQTEEVDNKLQLVKLVQNERKSIKQAAKYLGLKYSTAKKIIKKHRKSKKETSEIIVEDKSCQDKVLYSLLGEIQFYEEKLKSLYSSVKMNHDVINRLIIYCKLRKL